LREKEKFVENVGLQVIVEPTSMCCANNGLPKAVRVQEKPRETVLH
jgi:hypothetical protein